MTSITWAGPRCVQELGTFLGSQIPLREAVTSIGVFNQEKALVGAFSVIVKVSLTFV